MPTRKAAPTPPRPQYPRLRAGWALLIGATPALAAAPAWGDASVGNAKKPPDKRAPKDPQNPPSRDPAPPKTIEPELGGKVAAPRPPQPPPEGDKKAAEQKPKKPPPMPGGLARPSKHDPIDFVEVSSLDGESIAGDDWIVIHPHGPDEPCSQIGPASSTRRDVDLRRRT